MKLKLVIALAAITGASGICDDDFGPPRPPGRKEFGKADGLSIKGGFLDLDAEMTDRVFFKYQVHADSGVEVQRVKNGKILWRVSVKHLGVTHREYRQSVTMNVEKGRLYVAIEGAKSLREVRDLETGELIERIVSENR